jgi:hypothetical protein
MSVATVKKNKRDKGAVGYKETMKEKPVYTDSGWNKWWGNKGVQTSNENPWLSDLTLTESSDTSDDVDQNTTIKDMEL